MWIPIIDNKRYPARCIIRSPSKGGGVVVRFDRAGRRKRKNGTEYWRFKYDKENARPSSFNHIMYDKKGKPFVDLYNPIKGDYFQTELIKDKLRILDEDMRQWYVGEMEWRENTFKRQMSIWEKYIPIAAILFLGVGMMLMFIGYGQFYEQASQPMAQAASSLAEAASKLSGAAGILPPPS